MKMANDKRSDSGGKSHWPITLCRMIGAGVGGAFALFVIRPMVGELPFLLGLIAFCAMFGIGAFLGQLIGGVLIR